MTWGHPYFRTPPYIRPRYGLEDWFPQKKADFQGRTVDLPEGVYIYIYNIYLFYYYYLLSLCL